MTRRALQEACQGVDVNCFGSDRVRDLATTAPAETPVDPPDGVRRMTVVRFFGQI